MSRRLEIRTAEVGKEMPMLTVTIWEAMEEERILSLEASGQHFGKKN